MPRGHRVAGWSPSRPGISSKTRGMSRGFLGGHRGEAAQAEYPGMGKRRGEWGARWIPGTMPASL